MKTEIQKAIEFLLNFIRDADIDKDVFASIMTNLLTEKFASHWHVNEPLRGNGYRCIINYPDYCRSDKCLLTAASKVGMKMADYFKYFDTEFCLWIDPASVSIRFADQTYVKVIWKDKSQLGAKSVSNTAFTDYDDANSNPGTPPILGYKPTNISQEFRRRVNELLHTNQEMTVQRFDNDG